MKISVSLDIEEFSPLFFHGRRTFFALIGEFSSLPHTFYENINPKLFIGALPKLLVFAGFSSQEDMRNWTCIY